MAIDADELIDVLSDFADYLNDQIVQPTVEKLTSAKQVETPEPTRDAELWGEYIREAAVLVLVFLPLDLLIPRLLDPGRSFPHMWIWFGLTLVLSIGLLVLGIKVGKGS